MPSDYGIIGMTGLFIAVSQVFIYSGFGSALIRKKNCTQVDYSTIFYFNFFVSIICSIIILFTAQYISNFFNEPELKNILIVLGFGLIINSLGIIQVTVLTKNVNFKLQTKITIISTVCSGVIGIFFAYKGFGAWSLVFKTITGYFFSVVLLWILNKWRPIWAFSWKSLKEMFSFSSKLLAASLLGMIYNNIYLLVIGKFFSSTELGYYTRADHFRKLPSENIESVISRVTYPVLSQLQDDDKKLKETYIKLIKVSTFITFNLMVGMAAIAEPMILSLIGEKWLPSVIYLQMLCFVGMMYPLHSLNLTILNVKGRSDIFLKLDIIKKLFAVPVILLGILFGMKILLLGMMVNTIIAYYINSYYSGKLINFPLREQILHITPSLIISFTMGSIVFLTGLIIPVNHQIKFLLLTVFGVLLIFLICEIFKPLAYTYLKENIKSKLNNKKNAKV